MKKIAIFNHKGGVSKTTSAFNIGWILARKGKRVLLVDADSQCNLTLFCLGHQEYEKMYEDGFDNIKDGLSPAFKAKPKLIEASNCKEVKRNKSLFLLPGHIDLSEYEVELGVSFQLSNAFGTMKNLPGSFNYLIEKTAEKYKADYVLIDMNPSLSAINQVLLVSSDYFVVPTSPDMFSYMAVKSLARILPTWEKWAQLARPTFSDAEYPLPKNTPKFIGYTINDFNLSGGKANIEFAKLMDKIGEAVVKELVPNLQKEGMIVSDAAYDIAYKLNSQVKGFRHEINKFCIAEISNFNKLIAVSNSSSIPVYELSATSFKEGQKNTYFWFKRLFDLIADKIIILTNEA